MSFDPVSYAMGKKGGGGATLVDKTVTANGEYDPADDNADGYSSVTVNVSGNPNYVETISGTIANPWGQYDPAVLEREYIARNISLILVFESWDEYITYPSFRSSIRTFSCVYSLLGSSGANGATINYDNNFALLNAIEQENTDTGNPAGSTSCTLTIIHHPLPSGT